ncbi:MAG: c-type cytochrome, partial [Methylococcales bacterium]
DGATVVVDEAYLKEAIKNPSASVVKGFAPIMPPYEFSDADLNALIDYTRSLTSDNTQASESGDDTQASASGPDETANGRKIAEQQGCLGCHSIDGSPSTGPTWKGLFGKQEKLTDGSSVVVDEAFLRQSILEPNATVIEGFSPMMPSYELSPEQVDALVAYAKSLGEG